MGALSAFGIGWQYPELSGCVGTFSPSFWLAADTTDAGTVQATRIAHRLVDASAAIQRPSLFIGIGTNEETDDRDGDGVVDVLDDTQDLVAGWHAPDGTPRKGPRDFAGNDGRNRGHGDARLFVLAGGRLEPQSWAGMLPVFLQWAYAGGAIQRPSP